MKSKINSLLTGEKPIIDVWHYLVGNYRYKLYYSKVFKFLIRKHIFEQIKYRIQWMDRDCFYNGSCKKCGCMTTALQMASKPCEKPCYPAMMEKEEWTKYMRGGAFRDKNGAWTPYLTLNGKPTLIDDNRRFHTNKS